MSQYPLADALIRNGYCFIPAKHAQRAYLISRLFRAIDEFMELPRSLRLLHTLTVDRGGQNLSGRALTPDDGYLPPQEKSDRKHTFHQRRDWRLQIARTGIHAHDSFTTIMKSAQALHDMIRADYLRVCDELDNHPDLARYGLNLRAVLDEDESLSVMRAVLYTGTTDRAGSAANAVAGGHEDRGLLTRHMYQKPVGFEISRRGSGIWERPQIPKNHDMIFAGNKLELVTGGTLYRNGDSIHTRGGAVKALLHRGVIDPDHSGVRRSLVCFAHNTHDTLN